MSLGSDKLGKGKAIIGKGLANGVEFKTNPYEAIDSLFFDESLESVIFARNKYFRHSIKKFLEEMNFTFLESEIDEYTNCIVSLEKGTFKFINHMEDQIKYELPYDWDAFEGDIRMYVKDNPIVKKKMVQRNPENWDKPNGVNDEKDLIDKSMDSIKDFAKKLKEKFGVSDEEIKNMVKKNQKITYHSVNKTTYPAKGNPDLKLESGQYANIVDLIKQHEWEDQFESDYGDNIVIYMRENSEEGTEKRLLSEFGFEYCIDNIVVSENEDWSKRSIEVQYQGQEELPEVNVDDILNEIGVGHKEETIDENTKINIIDSTDIQGRDIAVVSFSDNINLDDILFGKGNTLLVNDGSSSVDLVVDNKEIGSLEVMGGINIFDYNQLKSLYKSNPSLFEEESFSGLEYILVFKNFKGDIGVSTEENLDLDLNKFIGDYELDNYLDHKGGSVKLHFDKQEYDIINTNDIEEVD
jgi:hypothetical protein